MYSAEWHRNTQSAVNINALVAIYYYETTCTWSVNKTLSRLTDHLSVFTLNLQNQLTLKYSLGNNLYTERDLCRSND